MSYEPSDLEYEIADLWARLDVLEHILSFETDPSIIDAYREEKANIKDQLKELDPHA